MIIYISALMLSEDARSGCRLPTRPLTNSMVILLQGPGSKAPVFLSENVDFCACGPQSICRSRPWPRTWTLISFPPRPRCGIAVPRAAATTRNAASSRGHTLLNHDPSLALPCGYAAHLLLRALLSFHHHPPRPIIRMKTSRDTISSTWKKYGRTTRARWTPRNAQRQE